MLDKVASMKASTDAATSTAQSAVTQLAAVGERLATLVVTADRALELAQKEPLAYKAMNRIELVQKELVKYVDEMGLNVAAFKETFHARMREEREYEQQMRHDLRDATGTVTNAIDNRVTETERRIAALQAYYDALQREEDK